MISIRTNLPEFKSRLNQISADLQKRAVREATRAAGGVFQKLAKANAPIRDPKTRKVVKGQRIAPGVLKASIGVVAKRPQRGAVTVMVIPRSGKRTRRGKSSAASRDAYYWAWVEQGHVITGGKRLAGGARRKALERKRASAAGKRTRPAWYLRNAFQSGQAKAIVAFNERMEKSIRKYSAL